MSDRAFLDTNIFIYTVDVSAPDHKRKIAQSLIDTMLKERQGVISYQVIQEFLNACLKKATIPLPAADLSDFVNRVLRPFPMVHSSIELFREGIEIHRRHQIHWYDSLIVAAAVESGCSVLYTEDLHHGAKINGVRIENPFR